MDLVNIETQAEDQWLTSLIDEHVWIGSTDAGSQGNWNWVPFMNPFWAGGSNGGPVDGAYTNWEHGDPDWLISGDCAAKDPPSSGEWETFSCGYAKAYVCEEAVPICVPVAADDTSCDGVDDDCDGTVDDGYLPTATACGVGACAAAGATSCVGGAVQDSCAAGTPAPADVTCDGVDDDCNGTSDDGYVATATACGVGACAAAGATSCAASSVQNSCVPGTPAPDDAACDGVDADCDGSLDEDFVSQPTACGQGTCVAAGATSCVLGSLQDSCAPGTPAPSDVACDGVDADCDGSDGVCDCDPAVPLSCVGGELHTCDAIGVLSVTVCDDGDICNGLETCAAPASTPVSIAPKAVFLRVNGDSAVGPTVVSLASLGLVAGDAITLRTVGRYRRHGADQTGWDRAGMVFSSTNVVLATSVLARVPGAIQSDAPDFVSWVTYAGSVPTDIPEDFAVHNDGTQVTVPAGAAYLIAGTMDNYTGDNTLFPGETFSFVVEAGAFCRSGAPLVQDDGNGCTADSCDPLSGAVHTPLAAGTSCDDQVGCTSDTCDGAGQCVGVPDVDDGDPCTTDVCDMVTGAESHSSAPAGTGCSGGDLCNGAEVCAAAPDALRKVDPRVSYLRDGGEGNLSTPVGIYLPAFGYQAGDRITLRATGTVAGTYAGNYADQVLGLFSSDGVVLWGQQQHRVPGAVASDGPAIFLPPLGTTPFDIPEDFLLTTTPVSVTVPLGASYLLLAGRAPGAFVTDTDGDFGVRHRGEGPAFGCQLAEPVVVDDGNACTTDACDPATGVSHASYPQGGGTCASLAAECGMVDDGCGTALDCGGCPAAQACGAQLPNRCGPPGLQQPAVARVGYGRNVASYEQGASMVEPSGSGSRLIIDGDAGHQPEFIGGSPKRATVRLLGSESHLVDRFSVTTNRVITSWDIYVSNVEPFDANSLAYWATVGGSGSGFNTSESFAPVRARYVRLLPQMPDNTLSLDLDDLRIYTRERQGGIVSLLEGGASVLAASSELYNARATQAIDVDGGSIWRTTSGTNQSIVVALIPGARPVTRFELVPVFGSVQPKNYTIALSNAGTDASDFQTVVSAATPANSAQRFVHEISPTPARFARLTLIDTHGGGAMEIKDFRVYSEAFGGPEVPFENATALGASEIASVLWDFGDGTPSTESDPLHTYSAAGTYLVTLTVTDTLGGVGIDQLTYAALEPALADFDWSPQPVFESSPANSTLYDQSSMTAGARGIHRRWESPGAHFYTLANSTGETNVGLTTTWAEYQEFRFLQDGQYPMTLEVLDSRLLTTRTTKFVDIGNVAPTIVAGPDATGVWDDPTRIGVLGTGQITEPGPVDQGLLSCEWDFGDGQTLAIPLCWNKTHRVDHTYAVPGQYTATLTVFDDDTSGSDSLAVTVNRRTTAVVPIALTPTAIDGEFELSAQLFDQADPARPMVGYDVALDFGTGSVTAVTASDSVARAIVHFDQLSYSAIQYRFDGDTYFAPSADQVDYIVPEGATAPIALRELTYSHEGTHFVLAVPQNSQGYAGNPGVIVLHLTSRAPAQATVTSPVGAFSTTVAVTPGQLTRVELPVGVRAGSGAYLPGPDDIEESGIIELKGVEVTSSDKVSAFLMDRRIGSTGAYLAYPVPRLGTDYVVAAYHNAKNRYYPRASGTQMTIVATEDDTTVTVVPSDDLTAGPALPAGSPRGVPVNFTLQKFEVLTLSSGALGGAIQDRWEDLSGSIVTSDKKIAVLGGNSCGLFNVTSTCDRMTHQVPPTESLGTHFVAFPFPPPQHAMVRVVANYDLTEVRVDGTLRATLARGEHFSFPIGNYEYVDIETSHPAHAVQFEASKDEEVGDPFLVDLVPVSQLLGDYVVATVRQTPEGTPPEDVVEFENWLTVVARTDELGGMRLDGQRLTGPWVPAGVGHEFAGRRLQVSVGEHRLTHDDPGARFAAYVYGYAPDDGYGYAAGRDLQPSTCAPTLSIPGDRSDNDCDGLADEELLDGIDNDGDGLIDEDLALERDPTLPNRAPTLLAGGSLSFPTGGTGYHALGGYDADGDPLTYRVLSSTGTGVFSIQGAILTRTGGAGTATVVANDGLLDSPPATFEFTLSTPCRGFTPPLCTYAPYFWPDSPQNSVLYVEPGALADFTYRVQGKDEDLDSVTTHLDSGPVGMTHDDTTGVLHWVFDDTRVGVHPVHVTLDDGRGGTTSAGFSLDVRLGSGNLPPVMVSTAPSTAQLGVAYTYQIAATDPDGSIALYSLLSGPAGMQVDPSGWLTWVPLDDDLGRHTIVVRARDDDGATTSQIFDLDVLGSPIQVTSSPLLNAAVGIPYNYDVIATDLSGSGQPLTFNLEYGPTGMAMGYTNGYIDWTPTAAQLGTHSVVVRIENGMDVGYQRFPIEVVEAAVAPRISSTPLTDVPLGGLYVYDVHASDLGRFEVLTFALDVAPPGMVIEPRTGVIQWIPSVLGSELVTVRVTDSTGLADTQSFTVDVVPDTTAPVVTLVATPERVPTDGWITLRVSATDDVLAQNLTLEVAGQPLTLDASGQAQFTSGTPGLYWATATATDLEGNLGSTSVAIGIEHPTDTEAPAVSLVSPLEDEELTYIHDVVGSISDDLDVFSYELSLRRREQNGWTVFHRGNGPQVGTVLGQLDTTLLENGYYELRVSAEDLNGNASELSRPFRVDGQAKVGVVQLSFVDMALPMAGIPIAVVRNYDSRVKTKGDFGYGWRLDIKQGSIQHNREPWDGVAIFTYNAEFALPCEGVYEQKSHFVEVRLSPREHYVFRPAIYNSYPDVGSCRGEVFYELVEGTLAGATLDIAGDATEWTVRSSSLPIVQNPLSLPPSQLEYLARPGEPFNPRLFWMTLPDGRKFQISADTGINYIEDRNGNSLSIDSNGVHHGGGQSVWFSRDAQGRIKQIIDPAGRSVDYGYDLRGDLVTVTNPIGASTYFRYRTDIPHHLQKIMGPTGREVAAMAYDGGGRLSDVCDAEGQCAHTDYDLVGRSMIQSDATSRPTRYDYDARGNVVYQLDALGHELEFVYDGDNNLTRATGPDGSVATYTYDGNSNLLTRVLPHEAGEDAADFTYVYTYNGFNERETVTLPSGGVIDYDYDAQGNQTAVKDGAGNVIASATFNPDGTLASRTDRFGTVTFAAYDVTGQPTLIHDIFGSPIQRTYDAGGQLVQHQERGSSMSFEYDGLGRPTYSDYGGETVLQQAPVCAGDADCDGHQDATDNCPGTANTDQAISDQSLLTVQGAAAAWRFEETSGNASADSVGSANGTSPAAVRVPGKFGQALSLSGSGASTVTIPNSPAVNPTQQLTLSAWIRPQMSDGATWYPIATKEASPWCSTDCHRQYVILLHKDGFIHVSSTAADRIAVGHQTCNSPAGSIVANEWTHVATVIDGVNGAMTIYLDGQLSATCPYSTGGIRGGSNPLYLGIWGGSEKFVGQLDEVVLYPRALTSGEVAKDMGGLERTLRGDACDLCPGNPDPTCQPTTCIDTDGDGVGVQGASACSGDPSVLDCNDTNAAVNPGLSEICDDLDNDCDGTVDEGCMVQHSVTVAYHYGDPADPRWTSLEGPTFGRVERRFTAAGRIGSWVEPNGDEYTRLYDGSGRVSEEIDALGNSTLYGYDVAGRLGSVTDVALGATTSFVRDSAGRVTDTTDALGNTTHTAYRLGGRLDSTTNARGFTTAFDRTPTSSSITDALTRSTTTTLTNYGLPVSTTYPGSASTGSLYAGTTRLDGSQSFPTSFTDEVGRDRDFVYDSHSGLQSTTDLAGNAWQYSYAASKGGAISYDVFSGDVNLVHAQGGASAYGGAGGGTEYRDMPGVGGGSGGMFQHYLDSVTSPMGETTQFVRGANGRMEQVVYPDGGTKSVTYGADGQPDSVSLPQGTTLTYQHDAQQREISRVSSLGEVRNFTYGIGDRVETMTDNTGTTTYEYDSTGRFSGIVYPHGGAVRYDRDMLGRTTTVSLVPGPGQTPAPIQYTYDANGNLATATDPFSRVTSLVYDDVDRLVEKQLPNGVTSFYTYDERDRVQSVVHKDPLGAVLLSVTYERAASGEPTKITRQDGSYVVLTYDAALRLDTETYYDASDTVVDSIDYDYDLDGNRTSKNSLSGGFESYTYTAGFKLASVTRGAVTETYAYDGGGRLTSIDRDGVLRTLEYNSDDKLVRVVDDGVEVAAYEYDGVGRRVAATEGGVTRRYLVAPNLGDGYETPQLVLNDAGQAIEGYTFLGEHPLARYDSVLNPEYYLQDAMGSVIGMVDETGALTQTANWDAFGELRGGSGVGSVASGGGFALHGMWLDDVSGLYHVRARTYDARVGRFTSRDPADLAPSFPEGGNPYVLVENSPYFATDPTGENSIASVVGTVVSAIVRGIISLLARSSGAVASLAKRALSPAARALRGVASRVPGRVRTRINVANGPTRYSPSHRAGFGHLRSGHYGFRNGQSQFTIAQDELKIVLQSRRVVHSPVKAIDGGGQFVRVVNTGRPIGVTRVADGRAPTSWIMIRTDPAGNLITAYPVPAPTTGYSTWKFLPFMFLPAASGAGDYDDAEETDVVLNAL